MVDIATIAAMSLGTRPFEILSCEVEEQGTGISATVGPNVAVAKQDQVDGKFSEILAMVNNYHTDG